MPPSEDVAATVLAGGGSRRFDGGHKALATVAGRSMIARVVAAARTVTDARPIVAVATDAQREAYADVLDDPVRFVTDAPDRDGPLAGLESAVDATEAAWLTVLGCDMPLVDPAAIEWIGTRRDGEADAIVPVADGQRHPLHAWYRANALEQALAADRDERSLQALLDRLPTRFVAAEDGPFDARGSLYNVNTKQDLADARALIDERVGPE